MKFASFMEAVWAVRRPRARGGAFYSSVAAAAQTLNATESNIDAFRARGGKLLIYTGWSDMALTPYGTIEYYESVVKRDKSATDDVRLIMMPGMDHCFGGAGPSWVNYLDEIDKWVTTNKALEQLTAFWLDDKMRPSGPRPVCAYPKYLKYRGNGNPRDAASFVCEGEK